MKIPRGMTRMTKLRLVSRSPRKERLLDSPQLDRKESTRQVISHVKRRTNIDMRLQAMDSSIFLKMGPGICLSCTNAKGAPEASNLPAITECICECMNQLIYNLLQCSYFSTIYTRIRVLYYEVLNDSHLFFSHRHDLGMDDYSRAWICVRCMSFEAGSVTEIKRHEKSCQVKRHDDIESKFTYYCAICLPGDPKPHV